MDRASAVAIEGHEYSELSNPSASHIPAPPQGVLGSDQAGSSATSTNYQERFGIENKEVANLAKRMGMFMRGELDVKDVGLMVCCIGPTVDNKLVAEKKRTKLAEKEQRAAQLRAKIAARVKRE